MLQVSLARLKQGHRTIPYPAQEPTLPDRFRGLPVVDVSKCPDTCRACAEACPTNAITFVPPALAEGEAGRGRPCASIWVGACFVPTAWKPARKALSATR